MSGLDEGLRAERDSDDSLRRLPAASTQIDQAQATSRTRSRNQLARSVIHGAERVAGSARAGYRASPVMLPTRRGWPVLSAYDDASDPGRASQ